MPRPLDLPEKVRAYAEEKRMPLMGPLVCGLSGGADSVCLLLILLKLGIGPVCVHVNHMIRGAEADSDERFCRELCEKLGVTLEVYRRDVPAYAKEKGLGLEEAARELRWECFYISAREHGARIIAVAHNRTDRVETFLFNAARGAGVKGMGSILPVREKDGFTVVRPLLSSDKSEITAYLDSTGQAYVTDSTNGDTDYTRNYIRNVLLPGFERVNPAYAANIARSADAAAEADGFIEVCAAEYINTHDGVDAESFFSLHPCVSARVISDLYAKESKSALSKIHVGLITDFIKKAENGKRLTLPSGVDIIKENGVFRFMPRTDRGEYRYDLTYGKNVFPDLCCDVFVEEAENASSINELINIYKLVKRFKISSDIIKNGVYVRSRADLDRFVYGGMTHTVKKLLSEKKVASSLRGAYPVFCDKDGILFVAPFTSRDGCRGDEKYCVTYCEY